jgi:hypothetical protein
MKTVKTVALIATITAKSVAKIAGNLQAREEP